MISLTQLGKYAYPLILTFIFVGIYLISRFKIKRAERKKLKSIKRRDINDAVETESPVENQAKDLKQKGISDIEDRFTFIYKGLPIILILIWVPLILLPYLGKLPAIYISIFAAVASVIVGVALRPFLENLFSGVVISFFKSIKIGDTVMIDNHYGLIEEIGLTYSVVKRWDWQRLVIPNTKLLQKEIQNLTMNDQYIWAHIEFYVSPDTDILTVEELAKNSVKHSEYFNDVEEPSFWVMDIQKDAIKCWLAAWADNPSYAWELRNDMRTRLIKNFQAHNINFHKFHYSRID